MKRYLDIVLASAAVLFLFPLMVMIALCIKFDSPGPVFYRQGRLGRDGRPFQMMKFRSMIEDAENMTLGLFNYKDDPRVTRIGRFLRNTSLDEIPQLFNVLKGEMSIVGPRPPVTYELGDYETLNQRYKKRFTVLPGITGLAQVEGRNRIGWDRKVDYDNWYIDLVQKKGIVVDIELIIKTVFNVLEKTDIFEEKHDPDMGDEEAAIESAAEVIAKAHETVTGYQTSLPVFPREK